MVSFTGQPGQATTRKVKPIWILMNQEMMGWQRYQPDLRKIICTSLHTDNHSSTSTLNFLQAGCSFWCPTNSVKALKASTQDSVKHYLMWTKQAATTDHKPCGISIRNVGSAADGAVHDWLCEWRFIQLIVAPLAVADVVYDDVLTKCVTIRHR